MIDAKQLRIGNYLQPTEKAIKELLEQEMDIKPKSLGEVTSIDNDEIRLYIDSMEIEFYYEDVQPIPLTEEWLLKFGFSKNENDVLQIETTLMPLSITLSDNYPDEKYKAWVYEDENFRYHIISDNIKYVHQLQNLYFDLTNEELNLNK